MTFKEYIFTKLDRLAVNAPWFLQEMIDDVHYPSMEKSIREATVLEVSSDLVLLIAEENRIGINCRELVEEWVKSKVAQ